ncbi:O-fucosyltransferase 8-like isoform X2 [Telopea speciosissima]|uniref:O-fucosyltransferase 8-like isoform X2 n=1 Tax=Telopea speciosissima TaxID=54955 RepID=UPI001CC55986|nr:O-fucosyltransferase 8-like isoform X2 [Telopea speciosissima]
MGKQGSPSNPRLPLGLVKPPSGMKSYQSRNSENLSGRETSIGRRASGGDYIWTKSVLLNELKNGTAKVGVSKGIYGAKRQKWVHKYLRTIVIVLGLMGSLFLFDSLMCSVIHSMNLQNGSSRRKQTMLEDESVDFVNREKTPILMYGRLLNLASTALAEKELRHDSSTMWGEQYKQASAWKPCAEKTSTIHQRKHSKSSGFMLVSANGGLNQQRVAVCNAIVVAYLLNATLVLPKFLYSNVWKDLSQFGEIYQEDYFMNILKDEVNMVKELPFHLQSVDIEAIGSLITDADIRKEAKPTDFIETVLPLLQRNGIVHFLGFGNRLGFDPLPSELQRLRCKCNFHALKFVPKIQEVGSLLVRRLRKYDLALSELDEQLLGNFIPKNPSKLQQPSTARSKYLALHLRFEIDMVAYSLCEFGGGENERQELQAYRESHFPLLIERLKKTKLVSPAELRKLGRCPLTPEEAALVLSSLGFRRGAYIYLAGSDIYGGQSRMQPFTDLYPNLVTKEDLLMPHELAPFRNFSSQLAALDFIACATADVFTMTDSGSQLSSLVSGYRVYYGGGRAPTLRPNKKRLAAILSENATIKWKGFEERVRKMIKEDQRVRTRGFGRSIYRQPRSPECMCKGN